MSGYSPKCADENERRDRAAVAQKKNYNKNRARFLHTAAKAAAASRHVPFELTVADVDRIIAPMVCSVTGATLQLTAPEGTTRSRRGYTKNPLAPSIDRIDSLKGYTLDNVRLVSCIYNLAKQNWRDQDVLDMATHLTRKKRLDNLV